jgi:protein-tyrosine phosphatase
VYIHCRAGHGRSAAAVFAWLMYKDPSINLEALNAMLRKQRDVRKTLWSQPNILKLHSRFLKKGIILLDIVEEKNEEEDSERQDDNHDDDDL